jgi:hypothetical protein
MNDGLDGQNTVDGFAKQYCGGLETAITNKI